MTITRLLQAGPSFAQLAVSRLASLGLMLASLAALPPAAVAQVPSPAQPASQDESAAIRKLIDNRQYDQALSRLDAALTQRPRDAQLRFGRAVLLAEMGRHEDAIQAYESLTQEYPELPEPYNNLAALYARQGQYEKARTALESALRNRPDYAVAHENLGDIHARLAAASYDRAARAAPQNRALKQKSDRAREMFSALVPAASASMTQGAASGDLRPAALAAAPARPVPATAMATAPSLVPAVARPHEAAVAAPAPARVLTDTPTASVKAQNPSAAKDLPLEADAEVMAALFSWAMAWSDRDYARHMAHYAPDFQPPQGQSLKAWQRERKSTFDQNQSVEVKVEGAQVSFDGNHAVVKFRQHYKADRAQTLLRKTITMVRQQGRWLITQEVKGP